MTAFLLLLTTATQDTEYVHKMRLDWWKQFHACQLVNPDQRAFMLVGQPRKVFEVWEAWARKTKTPVFLTWPRTDRGKLIGPAVIEYRIRPDRKVLARRILERYWMKPQKIPLNGDKP